MQVNDEDREMCAGLQVAVFAPGVERIASEAAAAGEAGPPAWDPPSVSLLDMELEPVLLSKAAQLGLPAQWVARLARLDNQRRQVSTLFSALCHKHVALYGLAEQNGQFLPLDCLYGRQFEREKPLIAVCQG